MEYKITAICCSSYMRAEHDAVVRGRLCYEAFFVYLRAEYIPRDLISYTFGRNNLKRAVCAKLDLKHPRHPTHHTRHRRERAAECCKVVVVLAAAVTSLY